MERGSWCELVVLTINEKATSVGFHVTRSRGSFAYPFMSPHRLVGVLLRLLTSCFCWCCPYTVQS
ncbi:hypothetical protein CMV42_07000 [Escherichia coli]|nr:hypothetical protein CMV46_07675 [Escherichia coli]RJK07109.1 hypothetical protein CMV42_07000 [Escherichia coli]